MTSSAEHLLAGRQAGAGCFTRTWPGRAALVLLLGLLAAPARPCGPFSPPTLLGEDGTLLEIPAHPFAAEVKRLASLPEPRFQAVESDRGQRLTAEIGREQLVAALGLAPRTPTNDPRIAPYVEVRRRISEHQEEVREWRHNLGWMGPSTTAPPRPEPPPVTLPDGLPAEFELYLRGAVAYHRGEPEAARVAWRELLSLPASERRLRSVWAEFMLGRLAMAATEAAPAAGAGGESLPAIAAPIETAATHFRRTRELAAAGFPDPLGLAQDSLGWEARGEWRLGRWDRAIELYGEQLASGDDLAGTSLHEVCRRALSAGEAALELVAAAPFPREVITLYLAGHWNESPQGVETAKAWAARLRAHGVETVATAGTIAWVAYQVAQFEEAGRWAELAAGPDDRARWVRAKLRLREGKLEEATELLEGLGDAVYGARTQGEAAAIRLARGEYRAALDGLLRAGYWMDAAYVAERLMTPDELIAYVDDAWPRELPDEDRFTWFVAGVRRPPEDWLAWRIRHLLARRLAREGRWLAAEPYYPGEQLPAAARRMAGWLACGDDPACPRERRAEALWQAAKALRGRGMALVGSELEPDFALWGGAFQFGFHPSVRADFATLPATEHEVERWRRSAIEPDRRYHYRYLAADLAWHAAELMPDDDVDTAWVLAVAGSWIKNLDPEAADRFYKALVRRCGETALGQEADRRRWFPPLSG